MIDSSLKGIMSIGSDESFFKSGIDKKEPSNSKTLNANSDTVEGLQNVADQFEAIFLETLLLIIFPEIYFVFNMVPKKEV